MIRRNRTSLRRDERGVTIVEFAIVAPVMILLIMGLAELSYRIYVQSILTGAMQKAARDSAIQGGAQQITTLDRSVMSAVWGVAPNATYSSSRDFYTQYNYIDHEPYTDGIGADPPDKVCNHNEPYVDTNANNRYDANLAQSGQGGASDVVLYRIEVTYPNLFPMSGLLGWTALRTIRSTTLLKNQPFATQSKAVVTSRNCNP